MISNVNYKERKECEHVDCFLLFNFNSKMLLRESKIDLLDVLNFCKYHLSIEGYVVIGDYF